MKTIRTKLITALLALLAVGSQTSLHALTYVRLLEEPGPAPVRGKSRVPSYYPRGLRYVRLLEEPGPARHRSRGNDGSYWLTERGTLSGYVGRIRPVSRPASAVAPSAYRSPIPTRTTRAPITTGIRQEPIASGKPSGPPPGYYIINRTHWAKNGTNRLADVKANHHPRCPGCGHH